MQQLLSSCAAGLPWIGLHAEQCISIGFFTEDKERDLKERQPAINESYCLDGRRASARMPNAAIAGGTERARPICCCICARGPGDGAALYFADDGGRYCVGDIPQTEARRRLELHQTGVRLLDP